MISFSNFLLPPHFVGPFGGMSIITVLFCLLGVSVFSMSIFMSRLSAKMRRKIFIGTTLTGIVYGVLCFFAYGLRYFSLSQFNCFFTLTILFLIMVEVCAVIISCFIFRISIRTKILIADFLLFIGIALFISYLLWAIDAYIFSLRHANALGGLTEADKESGYYAPFRTFFAVNTSFIFLLIMLLFFIRTSLLDFISRAGKKSNA
jgi:hypothetical protein